MSIKNCQGHGLICLDGFMKTHASHMISKYGEKYAIRFCKKGGVVGSDSALVRSDPESFLAIEYTMYFVFIYKISLLIALTLYTLFIP